MARQSTLLFSFFVAVACSSVATAADKFKWVTSDGKEHTGALPREARAAWDYDTRALDVDRRGVTDSVFPRFERAPVRRAGLIDFILPSGNANAQAFCSSYISISPFAATSTESRTATTSPVVSTETILSVVTTTPDTVTQTDTATSSTTATVTASTETDSFTTTFTDVSIISTATTSTTYSYTAPFRYNNVQRDQLDKRGLIEQLANYARSAVSSRCSQITTPKTKTISTTATQTSSLTTTFSTTETTGAATPSVTITNTIGETDTSSVTTTTSITGAATTSTTTTAYAVATQCAQSQPISLVGVPILQNIFLGADVKTLPGAVDQDACCTQCHTGNSCGFWWSHVVNNVRRCTLSLKVQGTSRNSQCPTGKGRYIAQTGSNQNNRGGVGPCAGSITRF